MNQLGLIHVNRQWDWITIPIFVSLCLPIGGGVKKTGAKVIGGKTTGGVGGNVT